MEKDISWIFELRSKVPLFLDKLRSNKKRFFFHYSLSGDLYDENINWGLGNTVYAVVIYHRLGVLGNLDKEEKKSMFEFIESFQKRNGEFYDPLIKKKAFLRDKLSSFRNLNFNNFLHQQTVIAETKQTFSAINLLEKTTKYKYNKFPKTEVEIGKYLGRLNWHSPWGAGAHFNALLFFLKNSDLPDKDKLTDFAIDWVNKLQSAETGSWYRGNPSLQQKINGAMKVVTALEFVNKLNFNHPEKLIDLCLPATDYEGACDCMDRLHVLHKANELLNGEYRLEEIKDFCYEQLQLYNKEHYFPGIGGFSFYKHKAEQRYYGAKITRGFNEPDLHGTSLFLSSIAMISQILGIDKELGFNIS